MNTNIPEYSNGLQMCGWVEFHSDKDALASYNYPNYLLYVHWVRTGSFLVHRVNGKFVKEKLRKNQEYIFNAYKLHALMPEHIASKCVSLNSILPQYELMPRRELLDSGEIATCRVMTFDLEHINHH